MECIEKDNMPAHVNAGKKAYGEGYEAQAVRHELGNFNYLSSRGYHLVVSLFGDTIRLRELKAVVFTVIHYLQTKYRLNMPPLSRNAKRSFPLLIKYITENYEAMEPVFPLVSLCDKDKKPINYGRYAIPFPVMQGMSFRRAEPITA